MLASSKHKYSKTLAFPDTYYELIINVLQSVELFCAYGISGKMGNIINYNHIEHPPFPHLQAYAEIPYDS